jgi:hypothetical protein
MMVGSGWSGHFNKTIAEVTYENIKRVGMPKWDEADQELAKALQKELGSRQSGLSTATEFNWAARWPRVSGWAAARTTSATCRGTCRR